MSYPYPMTIKGLTMNFATLQDAEIWQIANQLMDNLMEGSTAINHAEHTRDFTPRLRSLVTPDYLQHVCETYQRDKGFFTSRKPMLLLRRPDSIALIWQQQFSKVSGDYVAEMVLVQQDGLFLVDHVMVF